MQLQFVSADIVGKQTIISQLSKFDHHDEIIKREVVSEMQGWREVVFAYRDQFGWKKLFQMIPIESIFSLDGFIKTSPLSPSIISKSPFFIEEVAFDVPTTEGISNERAIIAEWDVRPPMSVVNPLAYFLFSCATSCC